MAQYAPKAPDGFLIWRLTADSKSGARHQIVLHHHACGEYLEWKKLYRLGWRIVPVEVREVAELKP